jgi:dihydrofolate reductase
VAKLIYSAIASLDGYVADADGDFSWARPDEEVHGFVNELERPIGTHLFGRRMYETLAVWDGEEMLSDPEPVIRDFAEIWRGADKIVYSRTLEEAPTARTRIEREFDPGAVRWMKEAAHRDLSVGGPELASQALATGLVDECQLILYPVVVGGGTAALPDGVRFDLELRDERRFGNGAVYLRYAFG